MSAEDREYRASFRTVRELLERAGCAAAVDAGELRAQSVHIMTVVARQRALDPALRAATGLSEVMEELVDRLEREVFPGAGAAPAAAAA